MHHNTSGWNLWWVLSCEEIRWLWRPLSSDQPESPHTEKSVFFYVSQLICSCHFSFAYILKTCCAPTTLLHFCLTCAKSQCRLDQMIMIQLKQATRRSTSLGSLNVFQISIRATAVDVWLEHVWAVCSLLCWTTVRQICRDTRHQRWWPATQDWLIMSWVFFCHGCLPPSLVASFVFIFLILNNHKEHLLIQIIWVRIIRSVCLNPLKTREHSTDECTWVSCFNLKC